ncbi:MAG: methyltransferase [Isosphaeraceae bacterium]
MRRIAILGYGVAAYALTLVSLVYAVGFIGGFLTPTQLDGPRRGSLGSAVAVDLGLMALFALQHSGMARPAFKRWASRYVADPAERSTYVLLSSLALLLLFALWRPIGGVIWEVTNPAGRALLYAGYAAGWVIVLTTTFLINHFDLFGLRQAWLHFRGRPYTRLRFATPSLYRVVRHPLYVGWMIVFWATPLMTVSHLLFAISLTVYILAAIRWEERDLIGAHPEYKSYRHRVPMLIPRLGKPSGRAAAATGRDHAASPAAPSALGARDAIPVE